jgi:hypothetical protein
VGILDKANSKFIIPSLVGITRKRLIAIHRADTLKKGIEINCLPRNLQLILSTQNLNPHIETSNQIINNNAISPPNSHNTRLNPKFVNINRKHRQRCSAKSHARSWTCLYKLIDRAAAEILWNNLFPKSQEAATHHLLWKEAFLISLRNPAGNIGQ